MDPLSDVFALMKPRPYIAGGYPLPSDVAIQYPKHLGIKCYAMLAGACWLVVEGVSLPLKLNTGDCVVLAHGRPFRFAAELSLKPLDRAEVHARRRAGSEALGAINAPGYVAGGHFALNGGPTQMLLSALPPVVHIRNKAGKAVMLWSIERMSEELSQAQPGSALVTQHLASLMLIQALRLHLADTSEIHRGWLAALADKQLSLAIANMHAKPGNSWTVLSLAESIGMSRAGFARRFREAVGTGPLEYLTRWRMMLAADQLENSTENLSTIAQALGYGSESAFGKAFRRVTGCSPRKYTQQQREERLQVAPASLEPFLKAEDCSVRIE
jgi:AraC-like DNA-binding protein